MVELNDAPLKAPAPAFWARAAGFMYLATIASYFLGKWIIDATHAARAGLLLQLATSWGTVLLAGSLYATLRTANPMLALLALAWRVGEAVLGALVVGLHFAILTTAGDPQAAAAATTLKATAGALFGVTTLFFTAGSTIFFWLFFESRMVPRSIALFGLAASVLFALLACAELLRTGLPGPLGYAWVPMLPAEIVTGAWLLAMGASPSRRYDWIKAQT